jgi:hypothetical protein
VTDETDPAAQPAPIGREVVTENGAFAALQAQESGTQTKECRLPGAVGPLEENDLSRVDGEVDTGERREPAE